jgi:tRNA-dihydrouridine synthase
MSQTSPDNLLKNSHPKTAGNFWQTLPPNFLTVAPMADVTDAAFRQMIAKYSSHNKPEGKVGGPDVMWTEFVAADGLMLATPLGKQKLMADLIYSEEERPIVAQLFTRHREHMEAAAALCLELGFDGVDINMGCPAGAIIDQGCGAAMIKTPELAVEVIRAAKRGAKSDEGGIPVSVKTRLGYNQDQLEDWIPILLRENIAALTVHARTRKDLSKVPARWERINRVVELRNELSPRTKIIGNGDVLSRSDAFLKIAQSGCDGAMVGRALFGNPWFFHPVNTLPLRMKTLPTHGVALEDISEMDNSQAELNYISIEERLRVMVEHSYLFKKLLPHKNFAVMKKHYKAYVNGFPHAVPLRIKLMEQDTPEAVEAVVHAFLNSNSQEQL